MKLQELQIIYNEVPIELRTLPILQIKDLIYKILLWIGKND